TRRDDDAALLVDERVAPLTHTFVDAVETEPELCLATLRDRGGAEAAPRRADAVLDSLAVGIELSQQLPVVALDGTEIAIHHVAQALALAPLITRQDLCESRIMHELRWIAEG